MVDETREETAEAVELAPEGKPADAVSAADPESKPKRARKHAEPAGVDDVRPAPASYVPAYRAGGHIDRHDGRGWVVDTDRPARKPAAARGPGRPPTPLGKGRYGGYKLADEE